MNKSSQEWLNFITKLNDREISKNRFTGITLWVLFSAIGVITINIFNLVSNLPTKNEKQIILLLQVTILLNLILAIFNVCNFILSYIKYESNRSITSTLEKKIHIIMTIVLYSFMILIIIMNLIVFISINDKNISLIPYFIISSCLISKTIRNIGFKLYKVFKKKNKLKYNIKVNYFFELLGEDRMNLLLDGILIILATIFSFIDLVISYSFTDNIKYFKISLQVVILIILFIILIDQCLKMLKHKWLEDLEKRIFIEDLEPDYIKKLYIKNFLGITVKNWFQELENKINLRNQDNEQELKNLDKQFEVRESKMISDYSEIDKSPCDRYCKTRLNSKNTECIIDAEIDRFDEILEIYQKKENLLREEQLFYDECIDELNEFICQIKLSHNEEEYFKMTVDSITESSQGFEDKKEKLSKQCSLIKKRHLNFKKKYNECFGKV